MSKGGYGSANRHARRKRRRICTNESTWVKVPSIAMPLSYHRSSFRSLTLSNEFWTVVTIWECRSHIWTCIAAPHPLAWLKGKVQDVAKLDLFRAGYSCSWSSPWPTNQFTCSSVQTPKLTLPSADQIGSATGPAGFHQHFQPQIPKPPTEKPASGLTLESWSEQPEPLTGRGQEHSGQGKTNPADPLILVAGSSSYPHRNLALPDWTSG